ncbi:solute carrier organic anion transporter family member 4A1 isoform X1 [Nematostella vectensis]|uniref:solute carrier organic anion transporter family member 4A1 isoform X1 n=1 Tax=Nematostella vectensis TaxID=45351 RepID=UPI0013901311|nr:solute carrier organic anion transporter family member 4A1 isoform X1 [Nematostella vectensis]
MKAVVDSKVFRYGWGKFRPEFLRGFNTPKWFLFFFTAASVISGIVQIGIRLIVLQSIERRFHLSSREIGALSAIGNIAGLFATIVTSYVGGYGNKVKWIGFGLLAKGLGCLLHASPHFLSGPYRPENLALVYEDQQLCTQNTTSLDKFCQSGDGSAWYYMFIFFLAEVMISAGGAPTVPLGQTYLDENTHPKDFPVYLGVFLTLTALGVGVGQVLGGLLLGIYVDIELPNDLRHMTPDDPRWVGAWWLGYFCGGIVTLIIAFAISGFTAVLPGSRERREEFILKGDIPTWDGMHGTVKEIAPSTKSLLRNPTFMLNSLAVWVGVFFLSGVAPFAFKYVTFKFGISPSTITSGVGVPSVFVTLGGIIGGSLLVRRLKLKDACRGSAKMCMVLSIVGLIAIPAFYIPGCSTLEFAGVNVPYNDSSEMDSSLTAPCNQNCSCLRSNYNPVCGVNGIMYFAPCQAGCTTKLDTQTFTNCSCVSTGPSALPSGTPMAKEGYCDRKCKNFYLFVISLGVTILIFGVALTPVRTVLIRCVPENQRAYALGFQVVFLKLFAFLPAPLIFGAFFDRHCVLWEDSCEGRGSCLYYEMNALDTWLQTTSTIASACGAFFFFLSWKLYKAPPTQHTLMTTVTRSTEDFKDGETIPLTSMTTSEKCEGSVSSEKQEEFPTSN